MANPVIHFEVQADDIERAKKFYEKTLDWSITQIMTADKGGMDYWGITTRSDGMPGINGGLYRRTPERVVGTFDCTILVPDIDSAVIAVKKNGGTISREKNEIAGVGFFASCIDTEGNTFGLMQATDWKPL
ncbi:MAG: VOC family protein [Candidatus Peribacteraceae bacterium]|nr:VOC family protein [Candidatus Peribacteraceae bacterium]